MEKYKRKCGFKLLRIFIDHTNYMKKPIIGESMDQVKREIVNYIHIPKSDENHHDKFSSKALHRHYVLR